MKICPRCHEKFPDDGNFCPMDGVKLESERGASKPASPPTAQVAAAAAPRGAAATASSSAGAQSGLARFAMAGALGGGVSGEVFRAKDKQTGADVAVKL